MVRRHLLLQQLAETVISSKHGTDNEQHIHSKSWMKIADQVNFSMPAVWTIVDSCNHQQHHRLTAQTYYSKFLLVVHPGDP